MVRRIDRTLHWRTGTHSLTGEGGEFLAGGLLTREATETSGWTAGPCGGNRNRVDPPRKTDCGTLLPTYDLSFRSLGGKLIVMPVEPDSRREDKRAFTSCPLPVVDELTAGAWPYEPVKVNVKKLFGRARTVTIRGTKAWRGVLDEGRAGATTTTSTLRWAVKLTRVR